MSRWLSAAALAGAALMLVGCMGQTSRNPPIEVWPDMDRQPKYKPQQVSRFYSDQRASRMPVEGTVARGHLNEDEAMMYGVVNNQFIGRNPVTLTPELLKLGQMRFNTYCSPCHDRTGSGKGLVPQKSLWIPTNLHEDRVQKMNDGEIFNVISHGRRSMPPYKNQIATGDRWAIVAYVRALQRTITSIDDVPADMRAQLGSAPDRVAPANESPNPNAPATTQPGAASPAGSTAGAPAPAEAKQ